MKTHQTHITLSIHATHRQLYYLRITTTLARHTTLMQLVCKTQYSNSTPTDTFRECATHTQHMQGKNCVQNFMFIFI